MFLIGPDDVRKVSEVGTGQRKRGRQDKAGGGVREEGGERRGRDRGTDQERGKEIGG